MDEIANKLTVDKKDEMNTKQNNDLQSNVKVSQMADILVSKFKQGLETPAKQRVVRFYLDWDFRVMDNDFDPYSLQTEKKSFNFS